jgi:hypothetical protein
MLWGLILKKMFSLVYCFFFCLIISSVVENECKWIYETSSFINFIQKIEHDPIPFTLHPTNFKNYYSVNLNSYIAQTTKHKIMY